MDSESRLICPHLHETRVKTRELMLSSMQVEISGSGDEMVGVHCRRTQSGQLDRSNKPHMMSVGGYSECDPPCCVEIIFFLASLSPILPLSLPIERASIPTLPSPTHSSPIIELVERGGRGGEGKAPPAMYNSGNTIINLSDSKRIDGAKVENDDDGKRGAALSLSLSLHSFLTCCPNFFTSSPPTQ